jgi:hypothetical protein
MHRHFEQIRQKLSFWRVGEKNELRRITQLKSIERRLTVVQSSRTCLALSESTQLADYSNREEVDGQNQQHTHPE